MSSGYDQDDTVPGLEYHGVPVPVEVFRNDAWDLREGEYWRHGVDAALAATKPLQLSPVPVAYRNEGDGPACVICGGHETGGWLIDDQYYCGLHAPGVSQRVNQECAGCRHPAEAHYLEGPGGTLRWCSLCHGKGAHSFVRKAGT